jgi:hypothetical protein
MSLVKTKLNKKLIIIIVLVLILLVGVFITWKKNSEPEVMSCTLTPETGPCKARILKYYFDQDNNNCQSFVWGGCNGTVPFQTLEQCIKSCHQ